MLPNHAILLPPIAMVILTGIVWLRLYWDRIGEMKTRRIHPQQLATTRQTSEMLQNVQSADHFRNLFEVPVLFYVLCAYVAIADVATYLLLAFAWGYVVLRCYHAYIHLTHNKVIARFKAYVAGTIVLYGMWAIFAFKLLAARS